MRVEKGLLYTKDHDWVKVEGNVVTVGLADYAQDHLGDIVYVELPEVDDEVEAGDSLFMVTDLYLNVLETLMIMFMIKICLKLFQVKKCKREEIIIIIS